MWRRRYDQRNHQLGLVCWVCSFCFGTRHGYAVNWMLNYCKHLLEGLNLKNLEEKKEPISVTQAITAINNIRLDAGQENSLSIEDSLCIIEQELKAKDDNIARKENDILMMVNVNNEQKKEIKRLKKGSI